MASANWTVHIELMGQDRDLLERVNENIEWYRKHLQEQAQMMQVEQEQARKRWEGETREQEGPQYKRGGDWENLSTEQRTHVDNFRRHISDILINETEAFYRTYPELQLMWSFTIDALIRRQALTRTEEAQTKEMKGHLLDKMGRD